MNQVAARNGSMACISRTLQRSHGLFSLTMFHLQYYLFIDTILLLIKEMLKALLFLLFVSPGQARFSYPRSNSVFGLAALLILARLIAWTLAD